MARPTLDSPHSDSGGACRRRRCSGSRVRRATAAARGTSAVACRRRARGHARLGRPEGAPSPRQQRPIGPPAGSARALARVSCCAGSAAALHTHAPRRAGATLGRARRAGAPDGATTRRQRPRGREGTRPRRRRASARSGRGAGARLRCCARRRLSAPAERQARRRPWLSASAAMGGEHGRGPVPRAAPRARSGHRRRTLRPDLAARPHGCCAAHARRCARRALARALGRHDGGRRRGGGMEHKSKSSGHTPDSLGRALRTCS